MKSQMISAVMVAALMLGVAPAYAVEKSEAKSKEWQEKWEAKRQKLFQELGLTDEQKKALDEIKTQNREQRKTLREAIKGKRDQLRQELQKPELDMARIDQIQSELKALDAQLIDARLQGVLAARKALTPEQFNKFLEKKDSIKEEFKKYRSESQEDQ